jgi:glycoprotein endo-alpha-1,2-mannosidase
VALRARVNGRYVCAESAGAAALIANRTAVGPWERFDRVDLGGGRIALRAQVNGRYVTAGSGPLIASATSVGTAQTFVPQGAAFRAAVNNQFVCAEDSGNQPLVANRGAIGSWEQFDVLPA